MTHRQISNYVFSLSDILGKGSTGTVYLGYNIHNGSKVAIKIIDLKTITNEVTNYLLQNEIKALQIINHPNVLHAYQVINDNNCYYIVTNYCSNKTLEEYIKQKGRMSEEEGLAIFRGIVEGYAGIRNYGIVHRDLKPANILFSENNEPVICDFGYCEVGGYMQKPKMYYNVGSPGYMAPETLLRNLYSQEGEVWSLGVIYYEMVYGKNWSDGKDVKDAMSQIKATGIRIPPETRLEISMKIVAECFQYNPGLRIKLRDLRTLLSGGGGVPKPKNNANLPMTQSLEYVGPKGLNQDVVLVSEVNKILIENNEIKRVKLGEKKVEEPQQPVVPIPVINTIPQSNLVESSSALSAVNPIEITFSPSPENRSNITQFEIQPQNNKQLQNSMMKSNISRPDYFPEYHPNPPDTHLETPNQNQNNYKSDIIEPSLVSLSELPPGMINQYILSNIHKIKQQQNGQEIKSDLFLNNYPLNGIPQNYSENPSLQPGGLTSDTPKTPKTATEMKQQQSKLWKLKQSAVSNFTQKQALNSSTFLNPTAGTYALNMAINQFSSPTRQKQQMIVPPSIMTQPTQHNPILNSYSRPKQQQYHQANYSREKPKVSSPTYPTHLGYLPQNQQTFTSYQQNYPQSALPSYPPQQPQYQHQQHQQQQQKTQDRKY